MRLGGIVRSKSSEIAMPAAATVTGPSLETQIKPLFCHVSPPLKESQARRSCSSAPSQACKMIMQPGANTPSQGSRSRHRHSTQPATSCRVASATVPGSTSPPVPTKRSAPSSTEISTDGAVAAIASPRPATGPIKATRARNITTRAFHLYIVPRYVRSAAVSPSAY
ncbi:unannotated protein [freshwater metagenome]|uniref:Unannotated protein n=1 Tax=freshwater metagenome TaxID=449393 RepID=A0A6J7R786_9ZZZZ